MPESFVSSEGANIWTVRTGKGFPVMLCSGGAGCCDYLQPVAEMIDDAAQVIRFEQRGCGRSDAVPPYDIETCLTDLENIRRRYKIDRWIIGGHSWGADLALFYALKHPANAAGLLCISGGRIHNDREWHAEYKRRREQEGEFMPDFAYPFNPQVNEQINRDWKKYIQKPNLLRAISRLNVPARFIYGERDIRPGWAVEQVARLMPDARFDLVEGAPHVIWQSHAAELRTRLRDFVEQIKNRETGKGKPL